MKRAPELANDAMLASAQYWQSGILPGHFKGGAGAKYGYARRSAAYLKRKGGKPSLVNSGSMRSDLVKRAAFKAAAGSVEVKMFARVLNLAPTMPQNSDDLYVHQRPKKKGGAKVPYPNMKREVKIVLDEERETMATVAVDVLEKGLASKTEASL